MQPTTAVRVAALEGAPRSGNAALVVGAKLGGGAIVDIAAKETVALDVAQSGRLNMEGPARVQLGTDASGQLLFASGVMSVNVPPAGDGKLIPQRIVTPRATFAFRAGTLGMVAVDANGDVLVHVIAGRAEIVPEVEGATAHVDPGAAKRIDAQATTDLKPGEDLSSALLKGRAFVRAASDKAARRGAVDSERVALEKLDAALAVLVSETEHGDQIAADHKQAIASGDAAARNVQQRALATHGQRLFRLRGVVLVLWERLQVAALRMEPDDAMRATLTSWRERVRPTLPRE